MPLALPIPLSAHPIDTTDVSTIETLLALVQEYGTVREMADFLRARGLAGGSTWPQLVQERILPALSDGTLTEEALIVFLRDAEEYGRQHIFLYQWKGEGNVIPSPKAVGRWLDERGATDVVDSSTIVNMPKHPTIAEVRRERASGSDILTIKIIETRAYDTFIGQKEIAGDRYSREYQRAEARAVNVVRFHSHGLVEFRIQSHKGASRDYDAELAKLQKMVMPLFNPVRSVTASLVRAKNSLYSDRHNLEASISFSGTEIRNSAGYQFSANCDRQKNLFSHEATDKSVEMLTADGEGYHDALNLWWLAQAKGRPKERIHVRLGGAPNEFVVTQSCTRGDYEHVLAEIRKYNR